MHARLKEVSSVLACPDCGEGLNADDRKFYCVSCSRDFSVIDETILDLLPRNSLPLPDMYSDPKYIEAKKRCEEIFEYVYKSKSLVSFINNSYHIKHSQNIRRKFKSGQRILDLGCGTGKFFEHMPLEIRGAYLGLDSNLELLQVFKKSFPDTPLILGDFYRLPINAKSIDHVLSLGVLEHIYYLEEALEGVVRILHDGGFFYITLPTEGGVLWNYGRRFSTQRKFEKSGINYSLYIKVEHCNTIWEVMEKVVHAFRSIDEHYYPFGLPSYHVNLLLNGIYKKINASPGCKSLPLEFTNSKTV